MTQEEKAKYVYGILNKYTIIIGDDPLPEWNDNNDPIRQKRIRVFCDAVQEDAGADPKQMVNTLVQSFIDDGWAHGTPEDEENKVTPFIVFWDDLAPEYQFKYRLLIWAYNSLSIKD